MALGICRLPIGMNRASGVVDADAAAWASAVTANGGTYSAGTLAAVSAFTVSAKASGYWTKLNRINLFCGNQLAAALVPLKVGGGSATETNVNFVGGDYTESTGLTGNASTKYLNTGLIPSVSLTLKDTHVAVYNRAGSAVGGGYHIGCFDASTNTFRGSLPSAAGNALNDDYDATALSVAVSAPYRLMIATATLPSVKTLYQNGASIGSGTSVGLLSTAAVYVCAQNANGTPASYVSHPLGGYSIGAGLSAADAANYAAHMQTFQTALGRNV